MESGRSGAGATATRRAMGAAALLTVASVGLSGCFGFSLGGGGGSDAAGFDGVQSATIQIVATGTFVPPAEEAFEFAGSGSGFFVTPDGIAVTNNHVVAGAGTLEVWVGGEDDSHNATVLGASECLDLAVIQVDGSFPYLDWQSDPDKVADEVWAAGFPLGDPEFTVTKGVISKLSANGEAPWSSLDSVLEHDARIRGGNSGGPLVDSEGEVVGVNYAGNDEQDFNWAIGHDTVEEVLDDLIAGESIDSLGVNVEAITDDEGNGLGVWVTSVTSGSVADDAGVESGDLLTNMEGVSVGSDGTLAEYCDVLRTKGSDATIAFELYRPDEDAYYTGQFNGDPVEPIPTIATNPEPNSGGPSTYAEYVTVYDDNGVVSVDVPAEWADVDGSPWTDDLGNAVNDISASTDLQTYYDTFDVPGVRVGASLDALANTSIEDQLTTLAAVGDGSCTRADEGEWDDGLYLGSYILFEDCGASASTYVALAAVDTAQTHLIWVETILLSDADFEALEHVLATFQAQF